MHWRIRLSVKVKRRFKVQLLPNFNINIQRANGLLSVAELLLARHDYGPSAHSFLLEAARES